MLQPNPNPSNQNHTEEYNPLLDQNVKDRNYTKHHITGQETGEPIAPPSFQKPTYSDFEEVPEGKQPDATFNNSYSELSGKEKTMGAEMIADVVIDMYTKACHMLGKLPEISEAKIERLMAEGEISVDAAIPTMEGDIPIKTFAEEFNSGIAEAFEVSEEFKQNVQPPLVRIFKKRGLGMTDEQLVGYYFLTDFGAKGLQAFQLKKMSSGIIDAIKQQTAAMSDVQQPQRPAAQPQASQPQPAQPAATPSEEYTEDFTVVETKPENKLNFQVDQETFIEPEEHSPKDFAAPFREPSSNPQFGDVTILEDMERVAQGQKPAGKTKRKITVNRSKTKTIRKPRKG